MTVSTERPILIVGAGVAGLTAAIALAKAGFPVMVIERATRFEEAGAGIQISPNASRIMIDLGLGPALARRATAPVALLARRMSGSELVGRVPLNPPGADYGAPFWTILRSELHTTLMDAARSQPRITLRVGRALTDMIERSDRVEAQFRTESGALETIAGRALVGADGLRSRARELTAQSAPIRFAGCEAWRTLVPGAEAAAEMREPLTHLWMGRGAHLVHYPVAAGRQINVVLVRKAKAPRRSSQDQEWSECGDAAELGQLLEGAARPVRRLLSQAPSWGVWSLYEQPPLKGWTRGRLGLIGDAAHAVLPFLAQGAALAIEDAAILAQEMARVPDDPAAALAAYADRRRGRAARVQAASRANSGPYHWGNGLRAWARDRMIAHLGEAGMVNRYRWLYGWTANS